MCCANNGITMMGRRSGKTVVMIRRAVKSNGVILVGNQARADDIIAKAVRLGIKPPRVVVFARGQHRGISIAEILVDHQDDCSRWELEMPKE